MVSTVSKMTVPVEVMPTQMILITMMENLVLGDEDDSKTDWRRERWRIADDDWEDGKNLLKDSDEIAMNARKMTALAGENGDTWALFLPNSFYFFSFSFCERLFISICIFFFLSLFFVFFYLEVYFSFFGFFLFYFFLRSFLLS